MGVSGPGIERFFHPPATFQPTLDETTERELQNKLYGLFLGMHSVGMEQVKRAYLSNVQYQGVSDARLAVCLVADRATAEKTATAIAKVFENICKQGQIDVLFVSDEQEKQVRETCRPFFSA